MLVLVTNALSTTKCPQSNIEDEYRYSYSQIITFDASYPIAIEVLTKLSLRMVMYSTD